MIRPTFCRSMLCSSIGIMMGLFIPRKLFRVCFCFSTAFVLFLLFFQKLWLFRLKFVALFTPVYTYLIFIWSAYVDCVGFKFFRFSSNWMWDFIVLRRRRLCKPWSQSENKTCKFSYSLYVLIDTLINYQGLALWILQSIYIQTHICEVYTHLYNTHVCVKRTVYFTLNILLYQV